MTDKEKTEIAVAVNYEGVTDKAPIVTAKGKGKLAERILDLAFDSGVKVRQDADLIELLDCVETGDEIPLQALGAVTEILERVYEINERKKK